MPDVNRLAQFLGRKWREWEAAWPGGAMAYIEAHGSDVLAAEFTNDPELNLASICGIFSNPPEEIMVDAVKSALGLSNPLLGGIVMILSSALLKACEQRRYLTRQQVNSAAGIGILVTLGLLIIVGAIEAISGMAGDDKKNKQKSKQRHKKG